MFNDGIVRTGGNSDKQIEWGIDVLKIRFYLLPDVCIEDVADDSK